MIPPALVKQHLRVLHTREDDLIQLYTDAAIRQFEESTERKLYASQDELDADTAPPEYTAVLNQDIQAGALLLIGYLYTTRNIDAPMPRATERLWQPYKVYRIS